MMSEEGTGADDPGPFRIIEETDKGIIVRGNRFASGVNTASQAIILFQEQDSEQQLLVIDFSAADRVDLFIWTHVDMRASNFDEICGNVGDGICTAVETGASSRLQSAGEQAA